MLETESEINILCSRSIDKDQLDATNLADSDAKDSLPANEFTQTSNHQETTPSEIDFNMVLREILFFLALALTTYDALQNSPPKISRTPTAVPFFDKNSLVMDWYKGQLSTALSYISLSEISFVMYYAPWDAESQHVRQEFNKVAQTMFRQVHFAAVNCWNPSGECRQHHSKISVWPIIMAYTTHLKSVIYTGPKDSASMVKFLRQFIKPLKRLTSSENLVKLITVCDAVVVGYTPMADGPAPYNAVYSAALKSLEHDPFADVCFAIVTSEQLAEDMGVDLVPNVRLMLWNETLEYPSDSTFSEENILSWIWSHVTKRASWITPPWQKSYSMQHLFSRGPVLILFTPRNHYNEETPNYDLLRETALEYNNCDNPWVLEITKYSSDQRHKYKEYERNKTLMCLEEEAQTTAQKLVLKAMAQMENVRSKVSKSHWFNKTLCKKDTRSKGLTYFLWGEDKSAGQVVMNSDALGLEGCCSKSEEETCQSSNLVSDLQAQEDEFEMKIMDMLNIDAPKSYKTSMLNFPKDPRSPINLQKRRMREICVILDLAQTVHPQVYPEMDGDQPSVLGLSCKTNSSLSFIAIDSLVNHHFAESLGIDITKQRDNTAVVILDNERESQYLLQKPFGERSLREFIVNFTMNHLPRHLRSISGGAKYTHYYGSGKIVEEAQTATDTPSDSKNFSGNHWCRQKSPNEKVICLTELNTATFEDFILQKHKAVLLVLCGGGSGACGGLLSMALMSVSYALRGLGDTFQVGRIDTSANDLPWQYTVSKYPTLVFFPTEQKQESRSYPENRPITVEGILGFVLTGFEPPLKLHAQLLLCNQTKDNSGMKDCLMNVRRYTVMLIGNTLKKWRQAHDISIKSLFLRRLRCLRTLAITLGSLHTTKLPPNNPIISSVMESIQSLKILWNINVSSPLMNVSHRKNQSSKYIL